MNANKKDTRPVLEMIVKKQKTSNNAGKIHKLASNRESGKEVKKQIKSNKTNKNTTTNSNIQRNETENVTSMKVEDIINTSENESDGSIDALLNKTLNGLDNKNFKNMYYISYKILFGFVEKLKEDDKIDIDKQDLENFIEKDFNEIMQKFTNNLKKRNRKTLQNELRCMGRKIDGKQCTRRKKNGCEYCQSHYKKLTNGRIDDDSTTTLLG